MSRGIPIPQHDGVNRLEYERAIRGLSYSEIARRAHVSPWTVCRAAKGKGVLAATAVRISAVVYAEPVKPELRELYGERGVA